MSIAVMATLFVVTPALAWHIQWGECTSPGTRGWVMLPDETWTQGWQLFVSDGEKLKGVGDPGEKIPLLAGSYRGKYSADGGTTFYKEVEEFTIQHNCPNIDEPRADIIQPCGDPQGGARYLNRRSTRPVTFVTQVKKAGSDLWNTVHRRTVMGGHNYITPALYLPPYGKVRVVRGNGAVLAPAERIAPPGSYGWRGECRLLRR
jgi:hypothetical protein